VFILDASTWRLVSSHARSSGLVLTTSFVTILLAITLLAAGPIHADSAHLAAAQRTLCDVTCVAIGSYSLLNHRAELGRILRVGE
jgi:hypothetical protein